MLYHGLVSSENAILSHEVSTETTPKVSIVGRQQKSSRNQNLEIVIDAMQCFIIWRHPKHAFCVTSGQCIISTAVPTSVHLLRVWGYTFWRQSYEQVKFYRQCWKLFFIALRGLICAQTYLVMKALTYPTPIRSYIAIPNRGRESYGFQNWRRFFWHTRYFYHFQ